MSTYAIAICDICGNEDKSPANHVSDSSYWEQDGGRRPIGWEYHMSYQGNSKSSVLFCDECETVVENCTEQKVKEMIVKAKE